MEKYDNVTINIHINIDNIQSTKYLMYLQYLVDDKSPCMFNCTTLFRKIGICVEICGAVVNNQSKSTKGE